MAAQRLKVDEVFGINRDLPLNYVTRESVDTKFVNSLTRDKHVVIYGSSKQGKTSLRKQNLVEDDYIVVHCSNRWTISEVNSAILKRAGFEITQSTTRTASGKQKIVATFKAALAGIGVGATGEKEDANSSSVKTAPLELDPEDVNDIIKALGKFQKFIVLEDFHYLPIETQKDFAVALKAYHEQSRLCFIVVGVWLEESRLSVYNGDLTGRVIGINADQWTRGELDEVIGRGEALLNIRFDDGFRSTLLDNCFDAVYIVQEACHKACTSMGIYYTQQNHVADVGGGVDAVQIISEVVNQQSGRYNSFLTQFAAGFQDTDLQMYRWLLYPILTAEIDVLKRGLRYRAMKEVLRANHPQGQDLNPGNLTQALQFTSSLQVKKDIKPIVLDYDQTNLVLNVVDLGFLVWLSNQDRDDLLDLIELPSRT